MEPVDLVKLAQEHLAKQETEGRLCTAYELQAQATEEVIQEFAGLHKVRGPRTVAEFEMLKLQK